MNTYVTTTLHELHVVNFNPTLVIAFYVDGYKEMFADACEHVFGCYPDIDLIGCSSESIINHTFPYIDNDEDYKFIFLFTDIKKEAYGLYTFFNRSFETHSILTDPTNTYSALLFTTHNNKLENDVVLNKIHNDIGIEKVFGALAANASLDFSSDNVSLYSNGAFSQTGYIFLTINESHYKVESISVSPFEPIGIDMNVTKVDGKKILEIEGKPALEMIENMIGKMSDNGLKHFHYPFYIWKENIAQSVHPMPLRSVRKINRDEKSLDFFNFIDKNSKIRPAIRVSQEREKKCMEHIKPYLKKNGINLFFVCVAYKLFWEEREQVRFMQVAEDNHGVFCGFHTFGELGYAEKSGSCCTLHNQTITFVSISS